MMPQETPFLDDLPLVADFIGQNWSNFLEFADVNWGLDPLQCEDLIRRIEAAAGMK